MYTDFDIVDGSFKQKKTNLQQQYRYIGVINKFIKTNKSKMGILINKKNMHLEALKRRSKKNYLNFKKYFYNNTYILLFSSSENILLRFNHKNIITIQYFYVFLKLTMLYKI